MRPGRGDDSSRTGSGIRSPWRSASRASSPQRAALIQARTLAGVPERARASRRAVVVGSSPPPEVSLPLRPPFVSASGIRVTFATPLRYRTCTRRLGQDGRKRPGDTRNVRPRDRTYTPTSLLRLPSQVKCSVAMPGTLGSRRHS